MKEIKPIAVGLVGCGNAGRNIHLPLFAKHSGLYRPVCCADVVPSQAHELAAKTGIRAMASVEALVADAEVELLVVATKPPVTHRDIALKALASGKHVVVEKPMADSADQCKEMIKAAESAGRVLSVHHNRRWDVDFLTARQIIASGCLGRIRMIRNEYTAGFSGSPYDWGIHLIDQTMMLSYGKRFVELTAAFCAPDREHPLESKGFFTCRLRTEDGVIHDLSMWPTFDGNAYMPGKMPRRFFIAGTEGVVYQEWCQRPEDAFAKTYSIQPIKGGKTAGDVTFVSSGLSVPDYYEGLFHAIRNNGPIPVTGEQGCRAVYAWELICKAACEGKTLQIVF